MSSQILNLIIDWSEVWALLIPLTILLINPSQPRSFTPVITYVLIGLVLNLSTDVIWKFKSSFPTHLQNNNPLYNIHSIIRFLVFTWFFIELKHSFLVQFKRIILIAFISLVTINFSFFESFLRLSSRLFTFEAGVLLVFCLQYIVFGIKTEMTSIKDQPGFWIIAGLSIYVAGNFFVFLFYKTLATHYKNIALLAWDVHNIFYIALCVLIAKAFYASKQR